METQRPAWEPRHAYRRTAALVVAVALLVLTPAASLQAAPKGAKTTPTFEAILTDETGTPIPGRTVVVYAEVHEVKDDGTELIELESLGSISTDREGALVGSAKFGQRAVELESQRPALRLFSSGPEGFLVHYVELDDNGMAAPASPTDDLAEGGEIRPAGEVVDASETLVLVAGGSESDSDLTPMGHDGYPCDFPYYEATNSYTNRWVPVQRSETLSRSNIRYSWETTNNTRLEIATGGNWGYHSAGLSASNQNSTTIGWSSTLPTNTQRRMEADWRYRRYDLYCRSWLGGPGNYHGSWEWRPDRYEGNRNISSAGPVSCASGTRRRHDNETWVARESTYTTSGFFSIGGVSLRSRQSSSSSHELRVLPITNPTYFCGSNEVPLYASMVRETQ